MGSNFEEMCKKLSKNSSVNKNKYILAKKEVENYIKEKKKETEMDILLNLKSEMMSASFTEHFSLLLSGMAFFLSIIGVVDASSLPTKWLVILILLLTIFAVVNFIIKYHPVYMWRQYICNAIEQIEKKMEK